MVAKRRAVFLDRDGVIVIPEFRDGRSFAPRRLEDFHLYPEAGAALARLRASGFRLVVVTNQPDVGAGLLSQDVLEEMHSLMMKMLPIDRIEVCIHQQAEGCDCRKPAPGMILRAAEALAVDLGSSIMIGDRASDIEAGRSAGCHTAFIDRGYTAEALPRATGFRCRGIGQAADWILSEDSAVF